MLEATSLYTLNDSYRTAAFKVCMPLVVAVLVHRMLLMIGMLRRRMILAIFNVSSSNMQMLLDTWLLLNSLYQGSLYILYKVALVPSILLLSYIA